MDRSEDAFADAAAAAAQSNAAANAPLKLMQRQRSRCLFFVAPSVKQLRRDESSAARRSYALQLKFN
jgi:hypothetical protein